MSVSQDTIEILMTGRHFLRMKLPDQGWYELGSLLSHCCCYAYTAVEDSLRGLKLESKLKYRCWVETNDNNRYFFTYAGFRERLCILLKEQGYGTNVAWADSRKQASRSIRANFSRHGNPHLLRFIKQHERGMIKIPRSAKQIAKVVRQIAQGFPKERLVVIGQHRNDIQYLSRQFRNSGLSVGTVLDGWEPVEKKQITLRHGSE